MTNEKKKEFHQQMNDHGRRKVEFILFPLTNPSYLNLYTFIKGSIRFRQRRTSLTLQKKTIFSFARWPQVKTCKNHRLLQNANTNPGENCVEVQKNFIKLLVCQVSFRVREKRVPPTPLTPCRLFECNLSSLLEDGLDRANSDGKHVILWGSTALENNFILWENGRYTYGPKSLMQTQKKPFSHLRWLHFWFFKQNRWWFFFFL